MTSRTRSIRWTCAAAVLAAAAASAFAGDPLGLMPEAASVEAERIDQLTYLILWVTGLTFVGVQIALVWFLWQYRRKPGVRAKHTHGNHTVELVWTVTPAAILVFLAVYQMGLWKDLKTSKPGDNEGAVAFQIYAKQFEWNFRYPGPDAQYGTPDDLISTKTLVVPVNHPVNAELRAMDVIHSFFLPNLRFKQDAVPGLHGRIWFKPNKLSVDRLPLTSHDGKQVKVDYFDVVCAELCGNQHTTMSAKLYVVTEAEYAKWLTGESVTLSTGTKIPAPTKFADVQSPYDFIWQSWNFQDDNLVTGPPKWHREPFQEHDYTGEVDEGSAPAETPAPGTGGGEAAAGGGAYDKAQATATLRGVVRYVGKIPEQKIINMADPKCTAHGTSTLEKTEVNPGSTLPHTFVYLVGGPSAGRTGYAPEPVLVDQSGCVYLPHVFGAMAGQDVVFRNSDSLSHNVHVKGKRISEFNKSQSGGQSDTWKPDSKEFGVKIICDIHSWMNSWMHVLEHPFFATSARGTGAFEIKGLYPGKHKFKVWHENWAKDGAMEFEIDLKDGENVHDIEVQGDK